MYRALPVQLHAQPYAGLAEAQTAHIDLVASAGALDERYGNALPAPDPAIVREFAAMLWRIRDFVARLSATGVCLPDDAQRNFAQSLLDFWAVRRTDLRTLGTKFQTDGGKPARRGALGRTSGRLLAEYDEDTAVTAAGRAEAAYVSLGSDAEREAARTAFLDLAQDKAAAAVPDAFVAAGVVVLSGSAQPPSYTLVHHGLPTAWERLAGWIEDARREQAERERVRSGAEAWEQNRSATELPRGEAVDRATRYARDDARLVPYARAARRQRTVERSASWAVMSLAIIVLITAAVVFWWMRNGGSSGPPAMLKPAKVTATARPEAADPADTNMLDTDALDQKADALQSSVDTGNASDATWTHLPDVGAVPTIAAAASPRVFVQLDETSRLPIDRVQAALKEGGFVLPGVQRLPNVARAAPKPSFDVRFYYAQDAAAAGDVMRRVASALDARNPPKTPTSLARSALAERVRRGTIEVWLFEQ